MPHKQKLPPNEKVSLVLQCLSDQLTFAEASRIACVDPATIRAWIAQYENEGASAFLPHSEKHYSPELKQLAVQSYLSGEGSQEDICKKYEIRSKRQLQNWIKVYNTHGDFRSAKPFGGKHYMSTPRITTADERIQVAKECIASGKNYIETSIKYRVSYQNVWAWTKRYEALGEAGFDDRRGRRKKDQSPRSEVERLQIENQQLKHKLYLAEMERDLLKKLEEVERRDAFRK